MRQNAVITLDDPVIVAQADPSVKDWGPWQFPTNLSRMADGGIHLGYHTHSDSAASYGKENPHAVSYDQGASWRHVDAMPAPDGTLLPNGDRLRIAVLRPVPAAGVNLPRPMAEADRLTVRYKYYRADAIPHTYSGYPFERYPKDGRQWQLEKHYPVIPDELRSVVQDNVEVYPAGDPTTYLPMPAIWDTLRVAPDGRVWASTYLLLDRQNGNIISHAVFLISDDNGRSFRYHSRILYDPDPNADLFAAEREGFTEPDIAFMPDGSVISLLRTQDSNGVGPSYLARSTDGGQTWDKPRVFDELGVWPQLLTLGNGMTLVSYGRPGFYLRATADPAGLDWGERVEIIGDRPGGQRVARGPHSSGNPAVENAQHFVEEQVNNGTCSYSGLVALDDASALVTYSDFSFPNAQGILVKTILARRVTVKPA